MIYTNREIKKIGKIIGIIFLVIFLYGVFRLFFPANPPVAKDSEITSNGRNGVATFHSGKNEKIDSAPDKSVGNSKPQELKKENDIEKDRKIIKDGRLTLQVKKTEKAAEEISQIAKDQGGEVFSTNFYERTKGQKNGTITVKVPVEKFEQTLDQIKEVASQVVRENTNGQDVTKQYIDLQAQLKNKKAEEESFVKLLDKAKKIEDVLNITKQISRVRGEIERLEGRIRYLDSQTEMSAITVNLREDENIVSAGSDWRPGQVVKKAYVDLIGNIQGFADGIIRFVILGIPSLIPFLFFLWLFYWLGKKIYKKINS